MQGALNKNIWEQTWRCFWVDCSPFVVQAPFVVNATAVEKGWWWCWSLSKLPFLVVCFPDGNLDSLRKSPLEARVCNVLCYRFLTSLCIQREGFSCCAGVVCAERMSEVWIEWGCFLLLFFFLQANCWLCMGEVSDFLGSGSEQNLFLMCLGIHVLTKQFLFFRLPVLRK